MVTPPTGSALAEAPLRTPPALAPVGVDPQPTERLRAAASTPSLLKEPTVPKEPPIQTEPEAAREPSILS